MVTDTVITERLNSFLLALTPTERWQALRGLDTNLSAQRLFTIIAVAAFVILAVLLLWVSYKRIVEERKMAEQLFVEYAEKIGLSAHERQILLQVVIKSRLKRRDAIFGMEDAFDHGATKLVEESVNAHQTGEESEQLKADLSFLREKLGFLHRSSISLPGRSSRLSSRQIPIGKQLHMTLSKTGRSASIESTVIKNNDMELTLKLTTPVKSKPGEHWRARFNFNTSIWEFDSSVVRSDGDVLSLNHTDNVRFINLRRFKRVKVNKPAFVAVFPFLRAVPLNGDSGEVDSEVEQELASSSISSWSSPEFVPAVVTEIAGLSLCLDVPLEVKVGERLLVIFKLDEEEDRDSSLQEAGKVTTSKIIQDIVEVRQTKAIENGLSIIVELIALRDSDINELVCAANAASPKVDTASQDIANSDNQEQDAENSAAEPAAAQGA